MTSKCFFKYISSNFWKILLIVSLIISFFIFGNLWGHYVNTLWVIPFVSHFIGSEWWIIPICSFFIVAYYSKEYFFSKLLNRKRIKFILFFTTIYSFCFFSGKWDYSLIASGKQYTAWANILILLPIICEIILFVRIRRKNNSQDTQETPLLEIEKVYDIEDSYQRNKLYITTYNTLANCFYKESSFALSITGLWGSGKTTFMNYLKGEYHKNSSVSIIEFEPWKSDTTESIVRNFFTLLHKELRLYIPNISSTLNAYIDLLLDEEPARPLKMVSNSLLKILHTQKEPYEDLKFYLEKSKHKTVVFIDDIDRLSANEIKEVLRLIRNTANFPFIQFIVAYDKDYVCETLKKDGIYNPDLYLEKFFNTEISLPKYEERIICNELLTRISKTIYTIWGIPKEDTRIHDMVYYRSDNYTNNIIDCTLTPKILNTIRDVIRFHNLFYLLSETYKKQGAETEIEFQDLFYLELLHYRCKDIYSKLCNAPLSILELNENRLSLKTKAKEIINNLNTDNQNKEITYNILYYLFSNSKRKKSISNLRNYSKYFMYRLDNKTLTASEFLLFDNIDKDEFESTVKQKYIDKYPSEFENQILEILSQIPLNNKSGHNNNLLYEKVYRIITLMLTRTRLQQLRNEVSNAVVTHLSILRCIDYKHLQEMLKLFNLIDFNSESAPDFDLDRFLTSILFKENLAVKLRKQVGENEFKIIHEFLLTTPNVKFITYGLSKIIQNIKSGCIKSEELLISAEHLSDILLNYFINYNDKLSETGLFLFYNCQTYTDPITSKVHLRDKALSIMKEEIERTPEKYFRMFIRMSISSHPDINTVSPEPYYKDIFGNDKNFETFLDSCKSNSVEEKRVKNYWLLYKHNDFSPIEFINQGNVQEKVDNCFKKEIEQLNELLYIKKQITENKVIDKKLIHNLNHNTLHIKLRRDISNIINRYEQHTKDTRADD